MKMKRKLICMITASAIMLSLIPSSIAANAEKYTYENELTDLYDESTAVPTAVPTVTPTAVPTAVPTVTPTAVPTAVPTVTPTAVPTAVPTVTPTAVPTAVPTVTPTAVPTAVPTVTPTAVPTASPTAEPETNIVFPHTSGKYDYGTKLEEIKLVGGDGDGTFKWENENKIPDVNNSGYNVIFTPSDGSAVQKKKVSVTIEPIDPTLSKKPKASSIYVKEELAESELSGGKMIGVDSEEVEGDFEWDDDSEVFKKSGTQSCRVVFTPDSDNYNEFEFYVDVAVKTKSSGSGGSSGGSSGVVMNLGSGTVYDVTATSSGNGSITPSGVSSVKKGASLIYNIIPNAGYEIKRLEIDGVMVNPTTKYTFARISQSHTIYAEFGVIAEIAANTANTSLLNKNEHIAYISGYSDGTFRPDKKLTRAETAVIISKLLKSQFESGKDYSGTFTDVSENSWYADYIGFTAQNGIMNGYGDGTFRPDKEITRAELLAVMAKLESVNGEFASTFSDVSQSHWAKNYIGYGVQQGWVSGYSDGTFRPDNAVTRAECVTTVNSVLDRKVNVAAFSDIRDIKAYTDVNSEHWAYCHIAEASNSHNYTNGADGNEKWTNIK